MGCLFFHYTELHLFEYCSERTDFITLVVCSVFDKLEWRTIGPKSFLFGTVQFSLWASGTVNYDYIITNSINS